VVRGSWFVVRGSWFVVRGSWFVVRGSWFVGSLFSFYCSFEKLSTGNFNMKSPNLKKHYTAAKKKKRR
jgi:hypothetical protein